MFKTTLYILLLLLFQNCSIPFKNLPKPNGKYIIGTDNFILEDQSRDEWFTENENDFRKIAIQVWYPAISTSDSLYPYIDYFDIKMDAIANQLSISKNMLKGLNKIKTNSYYKAKPINREFPLIIFSHGLGGTKIQNSINIEALVSQGYILIAIDHAYDALITILDDGEIATFQSELEGNASAEKFWQVRLPQINTRAKDIVFVINKLFELKTQGFYLGKNCDINNIGVFGHSFGGGSSIVASAIDKRITSCLNLDGWLEPIPEEIIIKGLDIPYCFIGQIQKTWEGAIYNEKKLYELHNNNHHDSYIFEIEDSKHLDYADIPYLNKLTRLIKISGKAGKKLTLDLNEFIIGFFNQYLKNNQSKWYDKINNNYSTIYSINEK